MANRSIFLSGMVLFFSLMMGSCGGKTSSDSTGEMDLPSAKVEAGILSDGISFRVEIPTGHHAYVDSGSQGNLVPISFIFDESVQPVPQLRSAPTGEYDKEFEANVLRGNGIWEFSFPNPEAMKDKVVQVRSQICDEQTGICYRPTFQKLTIHM